MNNKEKKLYKSLKKALDNGNYIIAEKLCLEILKNKPDDIFALYNYSCLLCIKGKMNEGKDIIKSILPSLKDSKLQYSLATLAKIYLENKDYDTAYKYLSQYNKNFPREPLFGLESNINAKLYKNQREYDKKQVINHIIKRHGYDPYAPSKFNKNINIPELFEEVTYKLTTTPRLTA